MKFKEAPDFEAPKSDYTYESTVEFRDSTGHTVNPGNTIISITESSSVDGVLEYLDNISYSDGRSGQYRGYIEIGGVRMIVTWDGGGWSTPGRYIVHVPPGVDPASIGEAGIGPDDIIQDDFTLPNNPNDPNEYTVQIRAEAGSQSDIQTVTVKVEDVDEMPAVAASSGDLVDLLDNIESEVVSTPPEPGDGKTSPPITPVAPQLTPDWWPQDELASTLLQLDMSDALDGF